MTERPESMVLDVVAGANGIASLYEDSGDNADYATVFATTPLRHESKAGEETVIISPREGSNNGLATAKAWTVNLLDMKAPKNITIDGKSLSQDSWNYDASRKRLSINIPRTDTSKEIRISVTY